jgi:hypothetical protein
MVLMIVFEVASIVSRMMCGRPCVSAALDGRLEPHKMARRLGDTGNGSEPHRPEMGLAGRSIA